MDLLQEQVHRRLQRDALELHRHRAVEADALFLESGLVKDDVDVVRGPQIIDDGAQRRVLEAHGHGQVQVMLDLALLLAVALTLVVDGQAVGQALAVPTPPRHIWIDVERIGFTDVWTLVLGTIEAFSEHPVAAFLAVLDIGLPSHDSGRRDGGAGDRIIRIQLLGHAGVLLGLGVLGLAEEGVVLLHQIGHLLLLVLLPQHHTGAGA